MDESITNNNSNNNNGINHKNKGSEQEEVDGDNLPESVQKAVQNLLREQDIRWYAFTYENASSSGENSYGQLLRLTISPNYVDNIETIHYIIKLSPKNPARRLQMKVVDYYMREVFMYQKVISEYTNIQIEHNILKWQAFNSIPKMYYASLVDCDEFIIFEDLEQTGFYKFNRLKELTFHHTALALRELAKFHSMSFILKNHKPKIFAELLMTLKNDNLFTENMEQITVEFGKKYVNRTIALLKDEQQIPNKKRLLYNLDFVQKNFLRICLKLVDGSSVEPYSVICHGDFWNNNILYRYDASGTPIAAKILDFQMSRYASPVLDVVHYLFTCTEKGLRDQHFLELTSIYHQTLSDHLKLFDLDPEVIYPVSKFKEQLKSFGVYGFCMSVFAVPFFISESCDLPNLDEVSEAIHQSEDTSGSETESDKSDRTNALLEEFDFLTEKSMPIFKRRMTGIVLDLDKYDMFNF